ncbi:hypothetical protein [Deinococcus rufus]|uniref:Uncharacterized protein n=1 Tax=Deinococcus rufus TaxID=2136097 RepID=A0ABV7Z7Z5_9DEIO
MKKRWNWSLGALLGVGHAIAAVAIMPFTRALAWLMGWLWHREPRLIAPMVWADDSAARLTDSAVRPVSDQRPRIEAFTLPRNTFAF